MTSVNYRLMDFNRSSDNYRRTDEDTPIDALSVPTDQYTHQSKPAEHDDDLSLGTDAQVFSTSETPQISSPGSSSISTG
ncbi:hypothetical protein OS493_002840 [Desmophyllum pertusum]|uniref:Uncharacterized protein n=1 Tax=Desmophyllum pertusum TaxID=174260 RepID=A0A9W9YG39_9CNID|nr:hypothetical protein OS493_002840 [Desmophyllum pertusum]